MAVNGCAEHGDGTKRNVYLDVNPIQGHVPVPEENESHFFGEARR